MFFLFADVRTGYMMAFTGKAKSSFLDAFIKVVEHFKRWGHQVKAFRSDAETVLKDGKMGEYLKDNGYIHELSTPEAHYQNFVERYVQNYRKIYGSPSSWTRHLIRQALELGAVSRHRLPQSYAEHQV